MKTFVNKKTIKNLIIIISILTILSGLVPMQVQAKTDTENGGGILKPIEKFVLFLGDSVMQWLQEKLVSTDSIEQEDGVWNFQYSPGIIFSGTVPAFDVNFINPNTKEDYGIKNWLIESRKDFSSKSIEYEWEEYENLGPEEGFDNYERIYEEVSESHIGKVADSYTYYCIEDNYLYIYYYYEMYLDGSTEPVKFFYTEEKHELTDEFIEITSTAVYGSTAFKLQKTIASWYNALRRIALVGLLSVLVYIGIRIVLTSSTQDKAKYKGMLKDWLVAICILFTLHYIMNITLTVTNEISAIFETGDTDELLNTLRGEIFEDSGTGVALAKTIMYATLVILTVTFTVQYLKRVIFMAFYTLIAPLITLTYPLDKIKDGQAQAFNMWIREYVYTALTQVIHLVIYYVLVGSALDLVSSYPLYAIIVLLFIKKADGIIKKMFGFDKSETVGTLGAAATGGLIMNAINSLAKGGSKGGATKETLGETAKSNVRTTSISSMNKALATLEGSGQLPKENNNVKVKKQNSSNSDGSAIKGALTVAGKYSKKAGKAALGAGLGATGAMLGFAAGISQGDISAALTGAVAGGKAGKGIGQRIGNGVDVGNIKNSINEIKDTWNAGAYGEEYAQNAKEIRDFKGTSTYKSLKDTFGDELTDDKISAMLQAGIEDKGSMTKVLESENMGDAIKYYTLAKTCPDSIYYNDEILQEYINDIAEKVGLSQTDAKKMRENMKKYRY